MPSKNKNSLRIIGGKEYKYSELIEICCKKIGYNSPIDRKELNVLLREKHSKICKDVSVFNLAKFILTGKGEYQNRKSDSDNFVNYINLIDVGEKYSIKNINTQKTKAVEKVEKLLVELDMPFIPEHPLVIKRSKFYDGNAKLYLLDFYIQSPFNFVIEVDGGYHDTDEQRLYDKKRDASIYGAGLGSVLRLKNEDVLKKDFSLIKEIKKKNLNCFKSTNLVDSFIESDYLVLLKVEYSLLKEPIKYYIDNFTPIDQKVESGMKSLVPAINHKYNSHIFCCHNDLLFLGQVIIKYTDNYLVEQELVEVFDKIFNFYKRHVYMIDYYKKYKL